MKFYFLILTFTIFVTGYFAFASTDSTSSTNLNLESQRSEFSPRISLTVQPVGFGPAPYESNGINLGYYLGNREVLQLEYTGSLQGANYSNVDASGWGSSSSSIRWHDDVTAFTIGLHYKRFLLSSFYVKAGLDFRKFDKQHIFLNAEDNSQNQSTDFQGESIAAGVAIGNQLRYGHFTIGCDWIGYVYPFVSSIDNESIVGPVKDYGWQTLQNDEHNYVASPNIEFLRFYLGAAF